jgi:hypothetical protein
MSETPAGSHTGYRPLRVLGAALLASTLVLPLGRCAGDMPPAVAASTAPAAAVEAAMPAADPVAGGWEEAAERVSEAAVMAVETVLLPLEIDPVYLVVLVLWPLPLLAFELPSGRRRPPMVPAWGEAVMCVASAGFLTWLLETLSLVPQAGYYAGMAGASLYLLALLLETRRGSPGVAAAAVRA